MRNFFRYFVFCLFLIGDFSCKKDGDTTPPVITINSPIEGRNYTVFDTIQVRADVRDDKQIISCAVTLLDASGSTALSTVVISPLSNPLVVSFGYELNDIHLNSGFYSLKISASDGKNLTNAFVRVFINAIPLMRKSIFLISRNSGFLNISKADTNFGVTPFLTLNSDYSGSDISSYNQQLFVSGEYSGNFNAINLLNTGIAWSKPAVVGSVPWFKGAYVSGNQIFVSYYNGFVRAYDASGISRYASSLQTNYYPGKVFATGNYFIDEQIYFSNNSSKLVVNSASTGAGLFELPLSQRIIQFCSKDADNIFIFGNNGNQGVMELYSISLNGLWSPRAMPAGKIRSATRVDPDNYLIASADGSVYKYTYSTNSLIAYLTGVNASSVFYDGVKNEVLLSSVNRLTSYDYTSAIQKRTLLVTDTIIGFHVLNNK